MYGQQYNPYPYAYSAPNPYQQRLNQLEQMYQQPPAPPTTQPQSPQSVQMLKGRIVASVEEEKASQVDFDGSTTYFACPGKQEIYAKSIGLNGLPIFLTYRLIDNEQPKTEQNVSNQEFATRLSALEDKVKELSNGFNATATTKE